MIRIGFVGYGKGGRYFHAPLIASLEDAVLAGVVTTSERRRAELESDHPGTAAFGTVAELLASGVDLVTVSTPPESRGAVVREVIDAGVAVVVDKPFALSVREARELVEHAENQGVPLSVFQNRRWDSEILTVAQVAGSGVLGPLLLVESALDRWEPENALHPTGGGWLLDLGSHLIDQVLTVFGPADTVYAEIDKDPDAPAEHAFLVSIVHESGLRSRVSASCRQPAPATRFRITGTEGTLLLEGLDIQTDQALAGESPATLGDAWGAEPRERWGTIVTPDATREIARARGDWPAFYRQAVAAVRDGTAMPVDPHSALATLQVLESARRSAETGTVVEL